MAVQTVCSEQKATGKCVLERNLSATRLNWIWACCCQGRTRKYSLKCWFIFRNEYFNMMRYPIFYDTAPLNQQINILWVKSNIKPTFTHRLPNLLNSLFSNIGLSYSFLQEKSTYFESCQNDVYCVFLEIMKNRLSCSDPFNWKST